MVPVSPGVGDVEEEGTARVGDIPDIRVEDLIFATTFDFAAIVARAENDAERPDRVGLSPDGVVRTCGLSNAKDVVVPVDTGL